VSLPLVIVTHALPAGWLEPLAGHCRLVVGPPTTTNSGLDDDLRRQLPKAEGLLTMLTVGVDDDLLDTAPKLKVVSNMAVGVDNIDLDACTLRGIPVGHTPGVLTESTADLTMALLLATARRLPEASRDAREGRWPTWEPDRWLGWDLQGATLGIVGLGQIGTAVAERARPFGLRLVYSSRRPKPDIEARLDLEHLSLDDLLVRSDFVSLHVPLSTETRGLIGEAAMRRMKPSAILINVARGPVVDTDALYSALSEGRIAAAGLDVTDPEPLPPDHPLYSLDNCLILPHIGSATQATRRRMAGRACDNILHGLSGRRLPYCANPAVYEHGYR
jgi:glyoxylate reductase